MTAHGLPGQDLTLGTSKKMPDAQENMPGSQPVRIMVVDDHTLVRAAFRIMLEAHPGFTVVGEAGTGAEAIEMAESLRPDLVLLDILMPDSTGLAVATRLLQKAEAPRVILLTMCLDRNMISEALRIGVHGHVAKFASESELMEAIEAALDNRLYISPLVSGDPVDPEPQPDYTPVEELLTPRQIEVLTLIGQGCSTKAIARTLGISTRTVDVHRSQLARRLQIRDIAGLIRYAIVAGLVKT